MGFSFAGKLRSQRHWKCSWIMSIPLAASEGFFWNMKLSGMQQLWPNAAVAKITWQTALAQSLQFWLTNLWSPDPV